MSTGEENKQPIDPMLAATFGDDYQTAGIPYEGEYEEESDGSEESSEDVSDTNVGEIEENTDNEQSSLESSEQESSSEQSSSNEDVKEEIKEEKSEPVKTWDADLSPAAKAIFDKLSKGEDKDVYELLKAKYGHADLTPEEKMVQYMTEKFPYLEAEEILFKLASEYGVGATEIDEDDMTSEQQKELRRQAIERKRLISEADSYFEQKAGSLEIPTLPSLMDLDEGYKEYVSFKAEQETLKAQAETERLALEKEVREVNDKVKTIATGLDKVEVSVEIGLDQGKLDLKTDFILDDKKKQQLADYAIDYTPTQGEVKAHTINGEFDMKGYIQMLAKRVFSDQITKAMLKDAISKDRSEFISKELKNSSFRNGETSSKGDFVEDPFISAMRQ